MVFSIRPNLMIISNTRKKKIEQALFFLCSVHFFKMLYSCLISIQLLFILKFEDFKIFRTIAYEISVRILNG